VWIPFDWFVDLLKKTWHRKVKKKMVCCLRTERATKLNSCIWWWFLIILDLSSIFDCTVQIISNFKQICIVVRQFLYNLLRHALLMDGLARAPSHLSQALLSTRILKYKFRTHDRLLETKLDTKCRLSFWSRIFKTWISSYPAHTIIH
jgi:hypothetical protein